MPRKPGDSLDVEVVGGLVEEDDVVVADEQGREGDAASLSTAEILYPGFPGDVGRETRDHVAHLRIAGPHVLVDVADDRLVHGLRVVEVVGLVEHRERGATATRDPPGVRL